jgi:hypothetical protein
MPAPSSCLAIIPFVDEISRAVGGAWSSFLSVLEKIIVPDWNDVMGWLPVLTVIGLVGPILTLLFLGWLIHFFRRPRFHVRTAEPAPVAAQRDENGYFVVAANVPYCPRDGLIYPPTATRCSVCRQELVVRCPVDDTTRVAAEQVCRACGTRYVLGAASTALTVQRSGGPPEGGAAVA